MSDQPIVIESQSTSVSWTSICSMIGIIIAMILIILLKYIQMSLKRKYQRKKIEVITAEQSRVPTVRLPEKQINESNSI